MKNICSISDVEKAWFQYLELAEVAQRTGLIEDGIAADHAWLHFFELLPGIE